MNTLLNKSTTLYGKNNSGVALNQGDIMILTSGTNTEFSFNTPNQTGTNYIIGIVSDVGGIPAGGSGSFIIDGYIPKINLTNNSSAFEFINSNGNSRSGTSKNFTERGSFAQVLTNGTTPQALFISQNPQSSPRYAKISDVKAANADGGAATSGSWQTRTLNTIDSDVDNIISLSSNRFTLQAGTYRISASAPAFFVNAHRARLQNITDGTTVLLGSTESTSNANTGGETTRSVIVGQFTITVAKVFEIQHRVEATKTTNGYGQRSNLGVSEVYTIVEIWQY